MWIRLALLLCVVFSSCSKKEKIISKQVVRMNLQSEIPSLDPRKARDLSSGVVLRMLFEGLMRSSKEGGIEPSLAERYEISEDGLQYTFFLKNTKWSDGEILTASDFVYSWKMILDPEFPTDIAYHLYPIKNARRAKMNEVPLHEIGVSMKDPFTLVVELEQPTPYFLELLTMPPFFPVPEHIATKNSNWALESSSMVSNGPFQMSLWDHADQISLIKNLGYWESHETKLDGIDLIVASSDTGLRMFEENKLDWAGSPLSTIPTDAIAALQSEQKFQSAPFLATSFCRVNVVEQIGNKKNPLSNRSFRQALAVSLDRSAIVEHLLRGGQRIAKSLVPSVMKLNEQGYFSDNSPEEGIKLLALAKEEFGEEMGPIVISYCNNSERNTLVVQALQKQWEERLNIEVEIEAVDPKVYFQRVAKKEYQLGLGSWMADFNDPINFLEIFKYKDNGTNNTNWENPEYIDFLNHSGLCKDLEERSQVLRKAEELLMTEMPIIPIYQFALNYVKNEDLTGVFLSPQGHLDLRLASFESKHKSRQ